MHIVKILIISIITILTFSITTQTVCSGTTERISISTEGEQANAFSGWSTISADGRLVAFDSHADNLVPGDTNDRSDVFVHDRQTSQTTRVSVSSDGEQAEKGCEHPIISADGRFVAFLSHADNLVPGDTNDRSDVFVHDRQTGQTTRVSVSSDGEQANGSSNMPTISADGRLVAFDSPADNLVPGDTNNKDDVFVHDRQTGQTTRVSVSSDGEQANKSNQKSSISADGRFVAFESIADNLVPGDTNDNDVFVHDRQTGQTTRVSVNSDGEQANEKSELRQSSISADGRLVAFDSPADNLVPGDTNDKDDVFVHDRYPEVEISVDINIYPKFLNLKSKVKKIISGIRLPEEYDPHDIVRDFLELSIPSCSHCAEIYPTWGFPLWKRYLALFPRRDLIDEIATMNLELPTKLDLRITGELDDGTPFEGLETIWVKNKRKKWGKGNNQR